jgi:acyl-coenzyme A thioesterase PaaI-like protein
METDGQSIFKADKDAAYFNRLGQGNLPEQMGIEILALEANQVKGRVAITESHLAPNGILHAAVATSLADMCCGYGTIASLPEGAQGHATIELKCNLHFGKTTQVWDATVFQEADNRPVAHFRCTQIILWPR